MRGLPGLVSALVLGACGAAGHSLPTRPGIHARDWRELKTEHFVMTTDLEEAEAARHLEALEQIHLALGDLYQLVVPGRAPPAGVIRIIHLAECRDLRELTETRSIGGFVARSVDFESERMLVTCNVPWAAREVLLHEVAHNFNHHYLGIVPRWLNEGLATFYQTTVVREGKAILGQVAGMDRHLWGDVRPLPQLAQLRSGAMWANDGFRGDSRIRHFASWKLVHLLTALHHDRFKAYLSDLARGAREEDSWRMAFGDLDQGDLAKAYAEYHLAAELPIWTTPYQLRRVPAPAKRKLRAGEAHAAWIQLQLMSLSLRQHKEPSPILDQVERLAAADPGWSGALFWRAAAEYRVAKRAEPKRPDLARLERLLRDYVAREPNDARARLGLVILGHAIAVPDTHTGLEPEPPSGLDELDGAVRDLLRVSQTPAELNLVAWHYALRRKPQIGFNFVERALAKDSACVGCLDTRALLYYQMGRFQEALWDQERVVYLLSEEGVPPKIQARLDRYRAAAGSEPP